MKQLFKLMILVVLPFGTFAQWNKDTTVRNAVCTAASSQYYPRNCVDGAGGAIFTWVDQRNSGSFGSIYAQKITIKGKTSWAANGILVFDGVPNFQWVDYSTIVSDSAGGAIIVYQVSVTGGARWLYAQHINASGTLLWGNGVKLTDLYDARLNWAEEPIQDGISADGTGGAFISYWSGLAYAQHINNNGNLLWGSTGVAMPLVGSYTYVGYRSTIQNTGNGTAVVGFSTPGGGSFYMQRIAANGAYMWGSSGLLVSSQYINQNYEPAHIIIYDAAASAIFTAFLTEPYTTSNVYVQKIDLNGTILWGAGGINLTNSTTQNLQPDIITDNKGGLFLCYKSNDKATVQHISSKGKKLWGLNGVGVDATPSTNQQSPVIVTDGQGGIIIVYKTSRNGAGYYSVYTQRFNSTGLPVWRANGVPVIIAYADNNHEVNNTVASTKGYAITCWHDSRNAGDNNDIYAARIGGAAGFGIAAPTTSESTESVAAANTKTELQVKVYPNPATSFVDISFSLANAESNAVIELYNMNGEKVKQVALGSLPAGKHTTTLSLERLAAGLYQVVLRQTLHTATTKFAIIK